MKISRRAFLTRAGASAAGLLLAPRLHRASAFAWGSTHGPTTRVAITQASAYDRVIIKQRVQHLFESLGGITDLFQTGKTVAIKINLTGGSGSASSTKLGGLPITESMWTHPEVVRAVGELILDCGVRGSDITIVEALWDSASYTNFGFQEVQTSLGATMVNLNVKDPYPDFVNLPVGTRKYYYDAFTVNQILSGVDVYVSIPKLKEHYEAAVTASLKNQIGIVPKTLYETPSDRGRRAALHTQGGVSNTHLPRSICDLNLARPVHLAVIDGVRNARGGEGVWNPTFKIWQDHVLLAGKEPVAADSVGAYLMGHDPGAATLRLPSGGVCDNHLALLHDRGVGTNQLSEIEPVGDGAGILTSVRPRSEPAVPSDFEIHQNFPNPFNPSTRFQFSLPAPADVRITVYDVTGQEIEVLVEGRLSQGSYEAHWTPGPVASGVYFCELRAAGVARRIKMIYQK